MSQSDEEMDCKPHQRVRYNKDSERPENRRNEVDHYLTIQAYKELLAKNVPVYFFDAQTIIEFGPVEWSIVRPDSVEITHKTLFVNVSDEAKRSSPDFAYNVKHTSWNMHIGPECTVNQRTFNKLNMAYDFTTIEDNAVFVIKGAQKIALLKQVQGKHQNWIYKTFNQKNFHSDGIMCQFHKKGGHCSFSHVCQMISYYGHPKITV